MADRRWVLAASAAGLVALRLAISTAQGGTWSLRTSRGRVDGYAWGRPTYGDVSWQSVVATIDGVTSAVPRCRRSQLKRCGR